MSISYLSENTRKTRRSLLLVSLIGYVISKLGLTLAEMQVFGSRFEMQNHTAIPYVLIMVILYFLITFAVYSLSEYAQAYKIAGEELLERHEQGKPSSPQEIKFSLDIIKREILEIETSELPSSDQYPNLDPVEFYKEVERQAEIKNSEYEALEELYDTAMDFQRRRPLLARITWKSFRAFVEMALPVVVAVYAMAHLAFFTEISNPNLNSEAGGPDTNQSDSIEVVTEIPVIADTLDTISGD